MKLLAAALLAGSASAFVSHHASLQSTSLAMSEAPAEVPMLQVKEKVPCFGATPLIGGEYFIGENYWDKLTMEYGSEDTGVFLRAAELKHGRAAMLAVVGFAFEKLGITFDRISPHEYLSVTQNIKFADLAAMGPLGAIQAVPVEGLIQIFCAIAAVEIYELTHRDGEIKTDERVAPGLKSGGLTGDLGWNPLKIQITDRRRLSEIQVSLYSHECTHVVHVSCTVCCIVCLTAISHPRPLALLCCAMMCFNVQNGRAAMFAISAWVAHDAVAGFVPLPLPWN
jgi:Chlorophyll A-B binding protein